MCCQKEKSGQQFSWSKELDRSYSSFCVSTQFWKELIQFPIRNRARNCLTWIWQELLITELSFFQAESEFEVVYGYSYMEFMMHNMRKKEPKGLEISRIPQDNPILNEFFQEYQISTKEEISHCAELFSYLNAFTNGHCIALYLDMEKEVLLTRYEHYNFEDWIAPALLISSNQRSKTKCCDFLLLLLPFWSSLKICQ